MHQLCDINGEAIVFFWFFTSYIQKMKTNALKTFKWNTTTLSNSESDTWDKIVFTIETCKVKGHKKISYK